MAERKSKSKKEVSLGGLVTRLVSSIALVLVTYNPTEWCYFAWVRDAFAAGSLGAIHFFFGVLLAIGWTVYGVASFRSLGALGLTLGAAFFVTLVWLLIDFGILKLDSAQTVTWVVLFCLAGLLALGLSWSHLWRRMTGQYEVDVD